MHPRRTYFYLTTGPHQPLPDPATRPFPVRTVVTPPLSTTTSGSEDADEERRRELSPSPEVDLSSPEFDDMDDDIPMPSTPIGSFSGRYPRLRPGGLTRSARGVSPPLEKDEREFTQTAEGLQKRKLSGDMLAADPVVDHEMDLDDDEADIRDDGLFGAGEEPKTATALGVAHHIALVASPAIRPTFSLLGSKRDGDESWAKLDSMVGWDRHPENIDVEEIDGLFSDF